MSTNPETGPVNEPVAQPPAVNAVATEAQEWGSGSVPNLGLLWVVILAVVAELVLLFATYSSQNFLFGFVSLLVFVGVLHLGGRLNVRNLFYRPWVSLGVLGGYAAIGVIWIGGYWAVETYKASEVAREDIRAFKRTHNLKQDDPIPDNLQAEWRQHVQKNPRIYSPPRYYERKAELAWRGLLWPVSMVHTFLADIVVEFYLKVVELGGKILDDIGNWMFKDITDEVNAAKPAPK